MEVFIVKKKMFIILFVIIAILAAISAVAVDLSNFNDKEPEKEETTQETTLIEPEVTTQETTLTEPVPDTDQSTSQIPDQSYLGKWYTDENPPDSIDILEITNKFVKFQTGLFRSFDFTATAIQKDGEWIFGNGISHDYSGYNAPVQGHLDFTENSVIVIYDNLGSTFDYLIRSGNNVYEFTRKNELSPDTEPVPDTDQPTPQSPLGDWCLDGNSNDASLIIYEITPDEMKFGVFFHTLCAEWKEMTDGIVATAIKKDGEYVFGYYESLEYRGPYRAKGRFELTDNHVILHMDDYGAIPEDAIAQEIHEYLFTVREDISQSIINECLVTHPYTVVGCYVD